MVLLKTLNGTLAACDRLILKIFFYGVKQNVYVGIVLNKFQIS